MHCYYFESFNEFADINFEMFAIYPLNVGGYEGIDSIISVSFSPWFLFHSYISTQRLILPTNGGLLESF